MVATISAREEIQSAQRYYTHLTQDDYYLQNEEIGFWYGRAAKFLDMNRAVQPNQFKAALNGQHPSTKDQLVRLAKGPKQHKPGWDICLSAPKAVSVLWALAPDDAKRDLIENAHKQAVKNTCSFIEENFAICRRGKGGKIKEKTTGLLFSVFNHKTSRTLCPQLHSHLFTFNMAPRKDASWGAILSKPLYDAQKKIGAHYREELHKQLQLLQVPSKLEHDAIKVEGISRRTEMAFSLRRQQILRAMEKFNYANSAKGFEKATLRTRQKKKQYPLPLLIQAWNERATRQKLQSECHAQIWQNLKPFSKQEPTISSKKLSSKYIAALISSAKKIVKDKVAQRTQNWKKLCLKASEKLMQLIAPSQLNRRKLQKHRFHSRDN